MGTKHGPNRFANYEQIHATRIRHQLDGGFLLQDGIKWEATGDGFIIGEGVLLCDGDIRIDVKKRLKILSGEGPNAMVQTIGYTYDAILRGIGNILRYDSPHPSHNQFHHVHRFKPLEDDKDGIIERIDKEEGWPTLGEVVDEVAEWYYDHFDEILAFRSTK